MATYVYNAIYYWCISVIIADLTSHVVPCHGWLFCHCYQADSHTNWLSYRQYMITNVHPGILDNFHHDCNTSRSFAMYLFVSCFDQAWSKVQHDGCGCIDSKTLPMFFYLCRRGCQSCTVWINY